MAAVAATELSGTDIQVAAVVGFPSGAHRTEVKALEAKRAFADGAAELDMVLNLALVRAGDWRAVCEVIAAVRDNGGDVAAVAHYLEVPLGLVQAAVAYYGAYPDEIDQWIELNEQESGEAGAAWSAGQSAVRRR